MISTSARLLRLLSLLHTHRAWSGGELSERLGVSTRTVRADVEALRELGYPVDAVRGPGGGYRLVAGTKLPPLLLDDEEAVAVAVGLRSAATGAVGGIEETSLQALTKLEQVLPSRLRHRVATFTEAVVPIPTAEPTVAVDVLTAVASAAREHQRLRFDYTDHRGAVTRREVEPLRLVNTASRWYLVAWDTDRRDWRTFRADRVEPKVPVGPRFTPREPPATDLAAYVSERTGTAVWGVQARIRLHASAASVAARITPTMGSVTPIDDEHCELRTGGSSLEVLAAYLGLLGVDFDVLAPADLVEHVRTLGERYRRAADPR
ncbi:YafY family transcriptional regulator [Occultella glacieicola]|uniref:YafY family transcriptional regulator n=1 Tax=Occultella glacieicola TaxID=2518684 RepID=A0ABY2E2V0_9MICO|nr:YafY family protein [Occultella glacieicola]TDE92733.1 YafY family transcriptional regulator [Occultella glacieicola]